MNIVYKIMNPEGVIISFNGSLRSFMIENIDEFGEFNDGKRKALQSTLKRGSKYKGWQIISVEKKISDECRKKEYPIEVKDDLIANSDGVFILRSKKRKVEIEKSVVRKMLHLYCTRRMTLNETAIELGLLREEVLFVLNKFKITKDSIPFIQEDIDSMTEDEMVEIVRLEKKRGFKGKLANNKHLDQEKELKQLHTKKYYFDRFVSAINEIESIDVNINYINKNNKIDNLTDLIMMPQITDTHFGVLTDSIFNKFDKHIAIARMEDYAEQIIDYAREKRPSKIIINGSGDYIAGIIHVSNRIMTDMDGVESCKVFAESISRLLVKVRLETGIPVEFYSVHGNHDRMIESKSESLESESFERFIVWGIDHIIKLSKVSGIKVVADNEIFGLSIIDIFGYKIATHHGHNIKNMNNLIIALNNEGYNIKEIIMGHFHQLKSYQIGKIDVTVCPSFIGTDSYATKMMLVNKPMQLIHLYDKDGKKEVRYIKFKN